MTATVAHQTTANNAGYLFAGAVFASVFVALVSVSSVGLADDAAPVGRQVFQAKCAKCHGARGEGTPVKYPEPLTGELGLPELAKFVAESMPPAPDPKCSADEAAQVAAFIFAEFYSKGAATDSARPRLTLSHLTSRQYRNAIADLMTSFRGGTGPWDDQRGLKGSYNTILDNGDGKHVMDRTDPEIRFNFEKSSPDPEKINPREFSVIWQGSIRAPANGDYEFIVRSENSVRLWVNDRVQPLIDAWVKSGDTKEFRGTVRLLGGRGYPVMLVFTKAGQGVMKSAEDKAKQEIKPASISLSWIPPGQAEQVVSKEFLSPHHFPESYFVNTPFPPDDRSTGFERGSGVSKEWDRATTDAAIEIADYVLLRLNDLTGGAQPGPDYESRLREFCRQFVGRAFRQPLSAEQSSLYVDRQFEGSDDLETSVQRVVLLALKSPRFLYHELSDPAHTAYAAASRLSFALWDAPPDSALLAAVAEGKLSKPEEIANQADRMSRDPRFRLKLREFFWQWMKLDQIREMEKSTDQFSGFDAGVARDLRLSLELFLDEVIASQDCDYRRLLLAESVYLNGRLSKLYGGGLAQDAPFQAIVIDPGRRAGILTHPYLMSSLADATTTSPIRRGVFVARGVLGRALLPPPDAFVPIAPSLHPELTTRERVNLQTKAEACQSCHAMINPVGFPFEHFDAIGRFRDQENGRPVDASGEYTPRAGATIKFNSARELAAFLVGSDEAQTAVVEKLFYFAVQQPIRTYGRQTSRKLKQRFVDSQFHLRKLFVDIGVTAAIGTTNPDQSN